MAATVHALCTCDVCFGAQTIIKQIFQVLDLYGWILDAYVVDFFEEKLWNKLPTSWTLVLQDVLPEEIGRWMTGEPVNKRVWPLSLLSLRKVTKVLQLNRNHVSSMQLACRGKLRGNGKNCINCNHKCEEIIDLVSMTNSLLSKHSNLFKKHVKMKKRYEIDQIAQVCAEYAQKSDSQCVVDIGAGMGHLARVLAFRYGLHVICVEQESLLSEQARKWDQEFLLTIRKHIPNFCVEGPYHFSAKVDTSCDIKTNIIDNLQNTFMRTFSLNHQSSVYGFIGLHPCGDLAATLLRLYSARSDARFICIVGCCYMKITLQDSGDMPKGYPLSQYVSVLKNHKLSYAALEVGCHAIEKHCDQLKSGNRADLIVHAYRAALETILIRKASHLRRTQLKNVKVKKDMTFEQYSFLVTRDLKSEFQPRFSDLRKKEITQYLMNWHQVVIFGSLRIMLAPLIETIVLLDRFLFLSEKRLYPVLRPIFDPKLSPRNFVLLSAKTNL